jgi:hypothetical protein
MKVITIIKTTLRHDDGFFKSANSLMVFPCLTDRACVLFVDKVKYFYLPIENGLPGILKKAESNIFVSVI